MASPINEAPEVATGGVRLRFAWERALREDADVRHARLSVLLVMATHYDRHAERIRIGIATVARQAGVSEKTVRRVLDWAEGRYLHRTLRGHSVGKGEGAYARPSEYELTLPVPISEVDILTSSEVDIGTCEPDIFVSEVDISELRSGHLMSTYQRASLSEASQSESAAVDVALEGRRAAQLAALLKARPAKWPAWCGLDECQPATSRIEDEDGNALGKCTRCHPDQQPKHHRRGGEAA